MIGNRKCYCGSTADYSILLDETWTDVCMTHAFDEVDENPDNVMRWL